MTEKEKAMKKKKNSAVSTRIQTPGVSHSEPRLPHGATHATVTWKGKSINHIHTYGRLKCFASLAYHF